MSCASTARRKTVFECEIAALGGPSCFPPGRRCLAVRQPLSSCASLGFRKSRWRRVTGFRALGLEGSPQVVLTIPPPARHGRQRRTCGQWHRPRRCPTFFGTSCNALGNSHPAPNKQAFAKTPLPWPYPRWSSGSNSPSPATYALSRETRVKHVEFWRLQTSHANTIDYRRISDLGRRVGVEVARIPPARDKAALAHLPEHPYRHFGALRDYRWQERPPLKLPRQRCNDYRA